MYAHQREPGLAGERGDQVLRAQDVTAEEILQWELSSSTVGKKAPSNWNNEDLFVLAFIFLKKSVNVEKLCVYTYLYI